MFPEYPDIYNHTQEIKATFNCKFLIQNNNNKTVGHLLCLAMLEKYDMIWKSYMFNLKKGTPKFYSTPVWTPCEHKLTYYNGENPLRVNVTFAKHSLASVYWCQVLGLTTLMSR